MAAKKKPAQNKASPKPTEPTPVSEVLKAKKLPAKARKKAAPRKPKPPVITPQDFEKYFFKLSHKQFIQLTTDWNEEKLKIKLKPQDSYDAWLNYFKTLSINQLKLLSDTGLDILPAEAYAALSFWRDIMINPSRIKNIHRAGLTNGKDKKTIADYAKSNDRLGVLEALRDQLAQKLDQGTGARDAGQLSAQMMEVMTQIDIQTRKLAPKKETALGALMADLPEIKTKRPSKNGGGARHTSFASRVTIQDVESK